MRNESLAPAFASRAAWGNGFDLRKLYSNPLPFTYSDSFSQETMLRAWSLEPDCLDLNAGSVTY